jgi:hypothetical protein
MHTVNMPGLNKKTRRPNKAALKVYFNLVKKVAEFEIVERPPGSGY